MTNDARAHVLARLRSALADNPVAEPVPREYGRGLDGDLRALLTDRLVDYKAAVHTELAEALGPIGRLLVPKDIPAAWLSGFAGEVIVDEGQDTTTLKAESAVLTGCAVAIADTGTIILDGGVGQGRRIISLLPDTHIVVVRPDQIVGRVPQAMERLAPARPQTWISGPSATSDIELARVEGVHGPRNLHVVLLVE